MLINQPRIFFQFIKSGYVKGIIWISKTRIYSEYNNIYIIINARDIYSLFSFRNFLCDLVNIISLVDSCEAKYLGSV